MYKRQSLCSLHPTEQQERASVGITNCDSNPIVMSMFTCICCLTGDTCVVTVCFCTFVYLDPDVFVYVTVSEFGLKLIVCYKCCRLWLVDGI